MKQYKFIKYPFILLGLGMGILLWVLESFVYWIYQPDISFIEHLYNESSYELLIRGIVVIIIFIFGYIVQYYANQYQKREKILQELTRAVEQSPSLVMITDTKGYIEYVNPKFTEVTGYKSEEVMGQYSNILKSEKASPETFKQMWETINAGNDWKGIFHNIKKNGEEYWESATISPIRDTDGRITHFVSVKEDITEKLKTEKRNHIYATIAEKMRSVIDSKEAARVIGEAADELWGWDAYSVDYYSDKKETISHILNVDTIDGKRKEMPPVRTEEKAPAIFEQTTRENGLLILRENPVLDKNSNLKPFGDTNRPSASLMFVPIRNGLDTIGIFSIQSYKKNAYTREDLPQLRELANYCGSVMERIQIGQSLQLFRSLMNQSNDAIYIVEPNTSRFLDVNEKACTSLGYLREELLKLNVIEISEGPIDWPSHIEEIRKAGTLVAERVLKCKDQSTFPVEINLNYIRGDKRDYLVGVVRDITERKKVEQTLIESSQFLQSVLDALDSHIAILDENAKIIAVNQSWHKFAEANGYSDPFHGIGRNYLEVCNASVGIELKQAKEVARALREILDYKRVDYRIEYPCDSPTEKRWFMLRANRFEISGQVRVVVAHENITYRKQAEVKLEQSVLDQEKILIELAHMNDELEKSKDAFQEISIRDELTGFYNRRELDRILKEEIERATRYKRTVLLVMIDIDHFKAVNDKYGHLTGDIVLRRLAITLGQKTRGIDKIARFGGEEFLVIVPEVNSEVAVMLSERIRTAVMQETFKNNLENPETETFSITISLGLALFPTDGDSVESLVSAADKALYTAKRLGRNRTVLYRDIQAKTNGN